MKVDVSGRVIETLSIDDLASKAWNDYEVPKELEKLLDENNVMHVEVIKPVKVVS